MSSKNTGKASANGSFLPDAEYVEALENLVIFMCGFHEDCKKAFAYQLDTAMKFPIIQGTGNQIAIHRTSQLPCDHRPKHGIEETLEELRNRRVAK